MAVLLDTDQLARATAQGLLAQGRTKPAVVVTIAAAHEEPFVDVAALESELGSLCDVYVLPTSSASWAFSDVMPRGRQVYGGASRVYSTDLAWVEDQRRSPLHFAYSKQDGKRVTQALVSDALNAAYSARVALGPGERAAAIRSGVVKSIVSGRVLVDLDSGPGPWPAVVHPESVAPGVRAERLFVPGQRVTGLHDEGANRLDVSESVLSAKDALAHIEVTSVLLTKVVKVGTAYATLALLPSFEVKVRLSDFGADDLSLGQLVTVGEVLPAEVTAVTEGLPTAVKVLPENFADLAVPVALLPNGPGWLDQTQIGPADEDVSVQAADDDDVGEFDAFDPKDPGAALLAESDSLRRRAGRLERLVSVLEGQLAAARSKLRAEHVEVKNLRSELEALRSGLAVRPNLFKDPREQLLHEVHCTWADRTTADDKVDRPWRAPVVGPEFVVTLEQMEGVSRAKVVEVIADVVSGHAELLSGRALHPLRSGEGANDAVLTRDNDGATCWRIALQQNTPSARRLHYWKLPDGSIELASVRVHDDVRA